MSKGSNQKLKLLYLAKIFSERTDETHGLTRQEILSLLHEYQVTAERKTLTNDFDELRHFGYDIVSSQKGRTFYYHLASREFELPELKLLVDSVQSSKFITEKKSDELIRKLESLVSRHEARQLHRQVVLSGRVKSMNESIYYSVDKIHEAINLDCQIRFQYFQWNIRKQEELRHDGAFYRISPWTLVWNNENYYLIGYDAEMDLIKHYRVDKMLHLDICDTPREGKHAFEKLDLPQYSKSLFGMYAGKPVNVTLFCENRMAGPIIDRFGKNIHLSPVDVNHFQTNVQVSESEQFLGWIIALGSGVKITGPKKMVEKMKDEARRLAEQYL